VGVGAAIGQLQPAPRESVGQRGCIFLDAPHQPPVCVRRGNLERHGHRREFLRVRAALLAGKDRHVDALGQVLIRGHDDGPARPHEGLVRRAGDHIGNAHGIRIGARRRHACRMADVGQERRTTFVRDIRKELPVGRPGVGGKAGNDEPGPVLPREVAYLIVVEPARGLADAIADHPEALAGEVELAAVGQMAALVQVHAHHSVAGRAEGIVDGKIGGRA